MPARPAVPSRRYLRLLGDAVFAVARLESEVERQLARLDKRIPAETTAGPDGWRSLDQLAMTLRRDSNRITEPTVAEYLRYAADALAEAADIVDTITRGTPAEVEKEAVLLRRKRSGAETPATEKWLRAQTDQIEDLMRGLAKFRSRIKS